MNSSSSSNVMISRKAKQNKTKLKTYERTINKTGCDSDHRMCCCCYCSFTCTLARGSFSFSLAASFCSFSLQIKTKMSKNTHSQKYFMCAYERVCTRCVRCRTSWETFLHTSPYSFVQTTQTASMSWKRQAKMYKYTTWSECDVLLLLLLLMLLLAFGVNRVCSQRSNDLL